ncbi:MAG: ABC transporter permease subunit [Oscillatoriales cyanobacterium RM1_1_9]|nr:ABC transporter permease subunit [Oscillatoriales cyanobacterium SM2_3_0]NJO44159.1 ABC transporter permease subunit [Oscillatoriales cyanobacterium RM2_1_1]NJO70915.1 ABC transporter permease subunit [Oscillatoriales cyanobacterium RM1_1_9]
MLVILNNILAIYRREFQSYFTSPLAYGIAGVFWLLMGYFFIAILLGPQGLIQQVGNLDQMGATQDSPIDLPYQFLQTFLQILGSMSLFILPMLSMGLYTEERKRGTLELLATSPITNWAVAVGKLLGVLTFFLTMMMPLFVLEGLVLNVAQPPMSPAIFLVAHGGLILLAAGVLSLGMFISSLTDSTILAAILTFTLVLFLWVIDLIGTSIGGQIGEVFGHLSLISNYSKLVQGTLDTSSLVLFASYIILGVFLTAQSIDALRFQRS